VPGFGGRIDHIVAAHDIALDRLLGEELGRGYLLEHCRMEDEVRVDHRLAHAVLVARVALEELQSGVREAPPHVVLPGFVRAQRVNPTNIPAQQVPHRRRAE
jgi:hypothetical protein